MFSLRDQGGHAIVRPAEQIERGARVYERGPGTNGEWEEIDYTETSFFVNTGENIDLEIVFVLDFTNSMSAARLSDGRNGIEAMLDAFEASLDVLPSAYRVGVVEFHDRNARPSVLSPLTTDRQALLGAARDFLIGGFDSGSSRVWDSLVTASDLFSGRAQNPRAVRVLAFLSDGRDTSSEVTREQAARYASERGVQLYAIGVGDVFQESELRAAAASTGGAYYSARDLDLIQERIQLLVNDLRGQYQLTYITLRRTGQYSAAISVEVAGVEGQTAFGPFDVARFFGPDNRGVIEFDPPSLDRASSRATVFMRALHVPRNIDRIRFRAETSKPLQVELVPSRDGGLLEGWSLSGPDAAGWYEAASDTPLEFGSLGLLAKLTFSNITEDGLEVPIEFDNSIYTGGKTLARSTSLGIGDVTVASAGPTPVPTATSAAATATPQPATPTPAAGPSVTESSRTVRGAIDTPGETDEYEVTQIGTGPVQISVTDIPLAEPGSTNRLRICAWNFPGDDCEIFANDRRYVWRQVPPGNYVIQVKSTSENNNFPYTITITTTKDDFAETGDAAHRLESGQPYSDAIRPDGDVDQFNIPQESSGPVQISVTDIPLAEPGSTNRLRICAWNFPGDDCEIFANDRRHVWRQVPRGNYVITVQSTSEYNNFPYTITITTAKDDFAETGDAAHRLESGQPYSDAIRPDGDVDQFNIPQESSGPVQISVTDIPLAEPGSTNRLRICAWNFPGDDCEIFANDRRHVWRQVPRGNYVITVQSTSEYNNFPYTITITTAKDDFAETGDAAHRLESGQPYSDAIRPDGDVDQFNIPQESSGPVEISVTGIPVADPANRLRICAWNFPGDDCEIFANDGRHVWQQVPRGNYVITVQSTSEYNSFPYTITITY